MSQNDRWLTSWSAKVGYQVWSLPDLRLVRTHPDIGGPWPDVSPDGRHAASIDESGMLRIWADGIKPTKTIPTGLSKAKVGADVSMPWCIFSPDGAYVLAQDATHGYRVWEVRTFRLVASAKVGEMGEARWGPSGTLLVRRKDNGIDRIDLPLGTRTSVPPDKDRGNIRSTSPDGRLEAVSLNQEVEIRSTRSGRRLFSVDTRRPLRESGGIHFIPLVSGLAFSSDGRRLFVLYDDGLLRT